MGKLMQIEMMQMDEISSVIDEAALAGMNYYWSNSYYFFIPSQHIKFPVHTQVCMWLFHLKNLYLFQHPKHEKHWNKSEEETLNLNEK